MIRLLFFIGTFIFGLSAHIICNRYLSFFGVGPDILLLLVLSLGFTLGPLVGETFGFLWGLSADVIGVNLFGHQALLFTVAGYLAGVLRRRVDSERPTPQIVIAIVATIFYGLGGTAIRSVLEQAGQRSSIFSYALESLLNALVVTAVFGLSDKWVQLWRVQNE